MLQITKGNRLGVMSRITSQNPKFVLAFLIGVALNLIFFVQPLSNVTLELTKGIYYLYTNNDLSYIGAVFSPLVISLGYYAITSDKRVTFPLWLQAGTWAVATVIVTAYSISPSNTPLLIFSYPRYLLGLGTIAFASLILLVILGAFQSIALRVILGMEIREQPASASFVVDIPYFELSTMFDEKWIASHALTKSKTQSEGVSLFYVRRVQGDIIALAFASKGDSSSYVALCTTREYTLYVKNSKLGSDALDGLVQDIGDRILAVHPNIKLAPSSTRDDLASRSVRLLTLRRTETSLSRIRPTIIRARRRVSIPLAQIPKSLLGLGLIVAVMMAVVPLFKPPNLVEIEVIMALGLILDLGVAIVDANRIIKGR
jgi:hypothetical protein